MNLNKLITISVAAVIALSVTMNLNQLQTWIWRAQAKLIYESRTETWGSPRFFPDRHFTSENAYKESTKPARKAQSLSHIQSPKVPLNRRLLVTGPKAE